MSSLEILDCGPGTTIQDLGRPGFRRFGVSVSGAMDRLSLAAANALVGNASDTACIEFALLGGRLRIEAGETLLACVGAELSVDGLLVPPGQSALAPAGSTIAVGPARGGVYTYLAVAGGLAAEPTMGSRSMHRRSGIGGTGLRAGDRIALGMPENPSSPCRMTPHSVIEEGPIRVMPGPQDAFFGTDGIERLVTESFTVHPRSDRMGYRLAGPRLEHRGGYNIVSDGVLAGSIQVPGDGRPIVLMRDCQTTGGYPKIATVISADVDRLAQRPAGSPVRFRLVEREEAVAAAQALRARIERLADDVSPLVVTPTTDALMTSNLVSGMVDARAEG